MINHHKTMQGRTKDMTYMNTSITRNGSANELLTVDDAALYLKVSRMTIWRWCNSGRLPAFKIGREWRIHRAVLDAMVHERMRRSDETEPASEASR